MDKKSIGFISAICLMLCISAAVVYQTWFAEKKQPAADVSRQIAEEMALSCIAMNQEARVINGGCEDMWIRAKVGQAGGTAEAAKGANVWCRLVSETIAEDPTEEEKQAGVWVPARDGYYYYSKLVSPGEQSEPLFQSIAGQAEDGESVSSAGAREMSGQNARVRVQAEAVQVNWLSQPAENGPDAFRHFSLQSLETEKGTVV